MRTAHHWRVEQKGFHEVIVSFQRSGKRVGNPLGIPLALSGLLTPILAVLAMVASSLTVVGNSLRISRLSRA